jgi:hypothetical protein
MRMANSLSAGSQACNIKVIKLLQMKKNIIIFPVIVMFITAFDISVSAQPNKALQYMDKIGREINAIMLDTWDYTSEVAHGKNARKVETRRKELVRTSKQAMDKVSKMEPFEGSTQYRDSVVSFLRINYIVLSEDFEKILNMEEIAEQSYDQMEAYLLAQQLANEKLDLAGDQMSEQEKLFASSHNINLVESSNRVARKLEKAGEVIKHYNEVYLVFFKSFKQEAYLLDAVTRKDINAMEQNKNALAATSAEGLEKIKGIIPYKFDKSLIFSCKNDLEFYQMEASKFGSIIDFYMKQENFEKIKTAFDAKPASGRTKEDINQYNAAINEYNSRLNTFNKLNNELNKARTVALNDWNNSSSSFLNRHVPRHK